MARFSALFALVASVALYGAKAEEYKVNCYRDTRPVMYGINIKLEQCYGEFWL